MNADKALKKLMDGNIRFARMKASHPRRTLSRLKFVAKKQKPFAIVAGCSDSRVPPEIIFDAGLGDLFVVREAGHVIGPTGLGSIEYAVDHLGVRLIMVLGHEGCGAVTAAAEGGKTSAHIAGLIKEIKAAVKKAGAQKGDLIENAVKQNVFNFVRKLKSSKPVLAGLVKKGKLKVVGGRYGMRTGGVEIIFP